MVKNKEELKAVLMAQEVYMTDGETLNPAKMSEEFDKLLANM